MEDSISALVFAPVVLLLTFSVPAYGLLIADVASVIVGPTESNVGIRIDVTDLIFAGLLISLYTRSRKEEPKRRIPYLGLWLTLGSLSSLAYLFVDINQQYLTDPVRIVYQLYRYCWKPILYFPLGVMLINDGKKLRLLLLAIILTADACALQAAWQGYTGLEAEGPFNQKNALAGFVVMPLLLSLSGLLYPQSRRMKTFYTVSTIVLLRGLTIAASRGGFVSALAGMALVFGFLWTKAHGRSRVTRFIGGGMLLVLGLFVLKPDLLERPNVQYLLTAAHPDEVDNYQWRKEKRWPHFLQRVQESPWIGYGSDVDRSLGEACITPHNGYLSVSMIHGVPTLAAMVAMALLGILNGVRMFRRTTDRSQQVLGLAIAGCMVSLLIHNHVDATFESPGIERMFWILASVAAVAVRHRPAFAEAPSPAPAAPRATPAAVAVPVGSHS